MVLELTKSQVHSLAYSLRYIIWVVVKKIKHARYIELKINFLFGWTFLYVIYFVV